MVYGVIGVGSIGAAIVSGLCGGDAGAPDILLSPRNAAMAADLAARHSSVRVAVSNQAVIDGSTLLILCVPPSVAGSALRPLSFYAHQVVVSVIAGVSAEALGPLVAPARAIIRALPLPAVARRSGVTPIHPPHPDAKALFDRLGTTMELADAHALEVLFASSATIAAHFATLRAISDWLVAKGLPTEAARRYVASTYTGLAAALQAGDPDFERLARDHATAGGLNEQFLAFVTQARMFETVERGLQQVLDRLTG